MGVKTFVLYTDAHQGALTAEEALSKLAGRITHQ